MRPRRRPDEGSITAETAVVLPVLVLVVALLLGVTRAVSVELSVQDAARVGARAAARGESSAEVRRLAAAAAPVGATVSVSIAGGLVYVVVRAEVRPLGAAARFLPVLDVAARAVAVDEAADSGVALVAGALPAPEGVP